MTDAAVVRWTEEKVRSATVSRAPYEHVEVFDVFHPALYACMLANLPPTRRYHKYLTNRFTIGLFDYKHPDAGTGYTHGSKTDFKPLGDKKGEFDSVFWSTFGRTFASPHFAELWARLFARTLEQRSPAWASLLEEGLAFKMVNRDEGGYFIGPHTDATEKWVSVLWYLPADESHRDDGGTAVVRSVSGREQPTSSVWKSLKDKDFRVVERARYVPNSAFAFAPCASSWHAVLPTQKQFQRDTIQSFIVSKSRAPMPKAACPPADGR